jgi:flagellar biosynthetic protein FliR
VFEFLNNIPLDDLVRNAHSSAPQAALLFLTTRFYTFLLVLIRMSGMMLIGPVFAQSIVPARLRVLLVVGLAFLITPALDDHNHATFSRLDTDHNGRLVRDEVPEPLSDRYEALLLELGRSGDWGLHEHEFYFPPLVPDTLLGLAVCLAGEFALGAVLGIGVMTILAGLQIGGQMIDQQTGLALGEIFNPGTDISGTVTGRTFYLLGVTAFLVMEPLGGHLLMMRTMLDTFQTMPVGEAYVTGASIDLMRDLVHQAFVLALLVAAPLLAVMALVAVAMGFLGHTVPQINILVVGFPLRSMISLAIIALTLSGAAKAAVDEVPAVIDQLRVAMGSSY